MSLEDNKATAEQVAAEAAFTDALEGTDQTSATETPPAEEVKAPEYVQLTRQELDELRANLKAATDKAASHDKQFSTWFGTVGRYEALLKEVQAKQSEVTGKLSSAAFDKMKEQFPELADMTKEAVQNALAGRAPEAEKTETPEQFAARIKIEMEILEDEHPGWQSIIDASSPGREDPKHPFRRWLASKAQAYQDRINKTESAYEISRAIDRYKAETKQPAKPAQQTARADARREQIAAAVTPRGDGARPSPGPTTAEEAFVAAGNGS